MSRTPRVLADFFGTFTVEARRGRETVDGRILLSRRELVLVGSNSETRIPLTAVLDIGVGTVPTELAHFFDDCVTVAFRTNNRSRVAAVEADADAIERFSALLFKTQLRDSTVLLKHPARVGGRVTSRRFVSSAVQLETDAIAFTDLDAPFRIDLSDVLGCGQYERTVSGEPRTVIAVRHRRNGQSMLAELTTESARRQHLLGRFLCLEHRDRLDAAETDLSTPEKRLLLALYAGASVAALGDILDTDPGDVSLLVEQLAEENLVASNDTDTWLTPAGQLLIGAVVEDLDG